MHIAPYMLASWLAGWLARHVGCRAVVNFKNLEGQVICNNPMPFEGKGLALISNKNCPGPPPFRQLWDVRSSQPHSIELLQCFKIDAFWWTDCHAWNISCVFANHASPRARVRAWKRNISCAGFPLSSFWGWISELEINKWDTRL